MHGPRTSTTKSLGHEASLFHRLLLIGALSAGLAGCDSRRNELLGTWVVESAEFLGDKLPATEAGKMMITFQQDRATWHFQVNGEWKTWDGTLSHDPTTDPKQLDMSEPNNPDKVMLCVYSIEGDKLTISMGAHRPQKLTGWSLGRMEMRRR